MDPVVRAGGIASGIDTNSLIDSLVQSARRPVQLLTEKRRDYVRRQGTLRDVNSKLTGLLEQARELATRRDFLSLSTTTSDAEKLTATANGDARPGRYEVRVIDRASTHKVRSATSGATTPTAVSAGDQFTVTVGADARTVTMDEDGATLAEIASAINTDAGDLVTATVVTDPVGGNDTLFIESKTSGSAGAASFADATGTALADIGVLAGGAIQWQVNAADDADLEVDGVAVSTSSNAPADVIPGVTLNLLQETGTGTVTVSVGTDKTAIVQKVKDLVAAYNKVVAAISKEFEATGTARGRDSLAGDGTLRRIKSALQDVASGSVDGITHEFSALARIGVKSDRNGVLSVDETALGDALDEDLDAVANVFAADEDAGTQGVAQQLVELLHGRYDGGDFIAGYTDALEGVIAVRLDGLDDNLADIDKQIARMERRVASLESSLVERFTAMEVLVSQLRTQSNTLALL